MGPPDPGDDGALALLRESGLFAAVPEGLLRTLAAAMQRQEVPAGTVLVREGDPGDALYLVEQGRFSARIARRDGAHNVVGHIERGGAIGEIRLIVGGRRAATVEAEADAVVYALPRQPFEAVCAGSPETLARLCELARRRLQRRQLAVVLPRVLGHLGPVDESVVSAIEAQANWVQLQSGETLFAHGDPGDSWFVVMSGRLAVLGPDGNGGERRLGEVGRGEGIGEMAILTGERRSASVVALRDSTLIRVGLAAFNDIVARYPRLMQSVNQSLAQRLLHVSHPRSKGGATTVALLPLARGRAPSQLAARLASGLAAHGPTLHLSAARLRDLGVLDRASQVPIDHPGWLRLQAFLEEQSDLHRFLLLEGDAEPTGWSEHALGLADRVLLVADAASPPTASGLPQRARSVAGQATRCRRTLVLLHPGGAPPAGTAAWMDAAASDDHVHLRLDREGDVARLCRGLAGRATSVALSGGGARGFAHVGVMRALAERGVVVDAVGGTSAGAITGASFAWERPVAEIAEAGRRFAAMRPFAGYGLPIFSLLRGERLSRALQAVFGDVLIEDLWLPFLAVSSDLTSNRAVIHDRGPLWEALRASSSLPGVVEPRVTAEGHLLVDGGIIDNLPVEVMRGRHGGRVVAVDVTLDEDFSLPGGRFPSRWSVLLSALLPLARFRARPRAPGLIDVVIRSTMLASEGRSARARRDADLLLRPPVSGYGLLELERHTEIAEVGYRHACERLTAEPWPAD